METMNRWTIGRILRYPGMRSQDCFFEDYHACRYFCFLALVLQRGAWEEYHESLSFFLAKAYVFVSLQQFSE